MPQDQVDEIKSKTDIVALLSEYIDLKKAGRNYKAICPFHGEKTPSFMVSPELQIYKCFGCGETGDVFTFLERQEGMDFYEALKFLADRAGIKLDSGTFKGKGEKEKIYELNSLATRFYHYLLTKHKMGKKALEYLTKDRGLKMETIETFSLGFSPESPMALKSFFLDKKKISPKDLETAGIAYRSGSRVVDRFRGRVIFPLFDHRGNPIGFAGRTLPDARKDLAKYINTPETRAYHKSNVLYGLNESKKYIKKEKRAIIVEGELDTISSWQAGIKNVVATKGTALTDGQIRLLTRFTKDAILALDADLAGDSAAQRGVMVAQNEGLEVKVARLGEFKDPDEAARKNPEGYKKALENAVDVWDFVIDMIFSKNNEKAGSGKAKISKEVAPILAAIDDDIVQAHYAQLVANRLGVPVDAVIREVSKEGKKNQPERVEIAVQKEEKKTRRNLLEERLLALAFQTDPLMLVKREVERMIKTSLCKKILEEYLSYQKAHKKFDASVFAEKLPRELVDGFSIMMLKDVSDISESSEVEDEISLVKHELEELAVRERLELLAREIRESESKKDTKRLKEKQEKFKEFSKKLSELEEEQTRGIIY